MKAALSTAQNGPGRLRDGRPSPLLGLVIAGHPLPSVAVTGFATALAVAFGGRGGVLVLVAAAILTGHLCIGWSNDAFDAPRDRLADRRDKPIVAGLVERRTVLAAAALAGLACVPLSLLLGWRAGVLHLLAVGLALAYNVALKSTPLSPLPYVLSFGSLPAIASLAAGSGWPPPGTLVAAGLLGAAAHAANTVGDTMADAMTEVRGLPQLLGPRASMIATALLVSAAALVLLVGLPAGGWSTRTSVGAGLLAAGALLAAGSALARLGPGSGRTAFRITLLAIAFVVLGFVVSVTHAS